MAEIAGPQFNNFADYDCIITAVFPDVQCFVRMKADPYFKEKVMPDHENFADTKRSRYVLRVAVGVGFRGGVGLMWVFRMSIGWIENHIVDGKKVD